ncbi:hypothetical protein HAX54_051445 [Datura stramonium]|uniref:Uncharacterized protein n=1 Tax=Datura stramonium TaxID=4076 RepID=A0ABS8WSA0_DATST|nr:hypothetical protein [Datura stramonium]
MSSAMDYEKKAICRAKADSSGGSQREVEDRRKKIVDEIRDASEKWGFFQLINHGVPSSVLDGMIHGIRKFHEQDVDVKKEYYSPDPRARQGYSSWLTVRSSLTKTRLLENAECANHQSVAYHYHPACPQPELTLGTTKHTDPVFLTILLQDMSGGLKSCVITNGPMLLHHLLNMVWLLILVTFFRYYQINKFVSAIHDCSKKSRAKDLVAFFFDGSGPTSSKMYGPIKEFISDENPPLYKEFQVSDYVSKFFTKPLDKTVLDLFRL